MSETEVKRPDRVLVYLELWADKADGNRMYLFIGGLERRPDVPAKPTGEDPDRWVYKLRPAGNEKGVLLSGGPFDGMKLAVGPDQTGAGFASGSYRDTGYLANSHHELWEFEPTAAGENMPVVAGGLAPCQTLRVDPNPASDPFAENGLAPRETGEPGVYVTEYPAEQLQKAFWVPVGYDIEAEESPRPMAETSESETPKPIKFREFL